MREVSSEMLKEIEWIHRQLKQMGKEFNKNLTAEYVGQSIEFIKGVLWQKQRQAEITKLDRPIAGL